MEEPTILQILQDEGNDRENHFMFFYSFYSARKLVNLLYHIFDCTKLHLVDKTAFAHHWYTSTTNIRQNAVLKSFFSKEICLPKHMLMFEGTLLNYHRIIL